MSVARELIAAFHEINGSKERSIADFTPSLVGLYGSASIFGTFLDEIDEAIKNRAVSEALKTRAINLIGTFIPQVAEYNGIKDISSRKVTKEDLLGITPESLQSRRDGIMIILCALVTILDEAVHIN